MADFKKLLVWQKAHALAVEGRGQESPKEFARYLRIAVNSASELEYHLIAGRDIGCISKTDFLSLLNQLIEVRKMLYGLLNHLRTGVASTSRR